MKKKLKFFVYLLVIILSGCIFFESIDQPASALPGEIIIVSIAVTTEGGAYATPYCGVCLPNGWTIPGDSFPCTGVYNETIYYDSLVSFEQESESPAPEGYYWWAGAGAAVATDSGSVYVQLEIQTDNQLGLFSIDYMLGHTTETGSGVNLERSDNHLIEIVYDEYTPWGLQAIVEGTSVVLNWEAPFNTEGLLGYNVYRDEQVINPTMVVDTTFTDENPQYGIHSYAVSSLYDDGSEHLIPYEIILIFGGLYVSPDGNNANSGSSFDDALLTINYAMSIITPDSLNAVTIFLAPGIYSPSTNGEIFPLEWINYVSLEGISEEETILDADSLSGIMSFSNITDAIIKNITLRNGSAHGIYCHNSSPSLENVTITGNSASEFGGGIYCDVSSPTLMNVTISDNSAYYGGGIYCKDNSNLIFSSVNRCNIYSNTVQNRGSGTDIFAFECDTINVIVDTFTVISPTDYYASPINNFNFDIFYSIQDTLINSDLFVSVDGDDSNSGISADEPLRTIKCALSKIYADSLNQNTIFLLPGIFSSDTNGEIFPIEWSNYVSLEGSEEEETILDANSVNGVMRFAFVSDAMIRNITVRNGSALYGGGIYCSNSSPSLVNVTISDNYALPYGGGIYCDASSPSLENVTISGNTADMGGGIYCNDNSSPSLVNVIITGNYASILMALGGGIWCGNNCNPSLVNVTISGNSARIGGGIYCDTSSPSLENVTISNNSAYGNGGKGGGIYFVRDSSPSLVNVALTGNSATSHGGGIYFKWGSNLSLENVIITGNSATWGGGIYCSNSNPSLNNVTITGNSSNWGEGGGIYFFYGSNPSLINVTISGNFAYNGGGISCVRNCNPSLKNVTITGNTVSNHGGGIYCENNSNPSLVNCIFWNDSPQEIYFYEDNDPNTITISYSDIQGGEAGIVTNNNGTVYWLEGNIDEDPLFVGTGEDPYSLLEDSPCIDAGIPDTTGLNLPPWDIIGNLRIWDGDGDGIAIIDMGAYEYGAPPYVIVNENEIVQTPEILLHQNYPNPFNPETTIQYSIPQETNVVLKIYNIKGQKVKQLVSNSAFQQSAGQHSVIWNGKDDNGKPVSSGIYFYKLRVGDFQKVRKMILLR